MGGLGPHRADVYTLWSITKEFAKVDLSLARCWEGHCNSMVLIDGISNDEQKGAGSAALLSEAKHGLPGVASRRRAHPQKK